MTQHENSLRSSLLALALVAGLAAAAPLLAKERVLDRESSAQSFELAEGAAARLVVDNVFGHIRVRSHDARRIDLKLEKTIFGRSEEKLERARREVRLEITSEPDLVDLYVNGPFRNPTRREWSGSWHDPGYRVVYDFELSVPRDIDLEVKTVDGGTVEVAGVRGHFEVINVNGGIEMSGVAGSGSVETVNGPVRVVFDANPTGDSSFVTVNGDVEVFFRASLSADLNLQSTFGELWSEFDVRPLAARPPVESVEGGSRIIRTDTGARVRVGGGGPSHSFQTLNGDVLIRLAESGAALEETP